MQLSLSFCDFMIGMAEFWYQEGYRGGFCSKLLEAPKASVSWLQDSLTTGLG